ncbi:MAG TPA: hypothetical protein VN132_16660, partial [Bdellovibrio sp.]|nr:hypothetical protein [Bdellovibrio sp.]
VNLSTRYVPTRTWSIFAATTYSTAESKNAVATRTNSSFTQALLGFDFLMYDDAFQLVPELAMLIPFQKVDGTGDQVLNSEGVFEGWARMTAQKDFGATRAYAWIGFNYRGEGRSFLMPYGGGLQLKLNSLKLGGEIFGSQSVTDDTDTNNKVLRQAVVDTLDAGSYKFYYPNPSVVDSVVYATWNVTPAWSLQLNGGATLAGENTAAGYHVGGFIRYSFDMSKGYVKEEPFKPVQNPVPRGKSTLNATPDNDWSSEKKVRNFQEQTDDGVDQTMFKPKPTQKSKTVDQELQKQMDDAEFQIELKQNRKRSGAH